ncbi:MAG: LysE family transporter [Dehalococcoidia bacterium]
MAVGALAAIFATSFLVSLTGALSPGPLTTLAVREGVRRGFWAGPALALGHGVIELALVVALALGLNRLLDEEGVTAAIALVGGTFLLWLGVQVIRTAPRQELVIGEGSALDGTPTRPSGRGWLRSALAEEVRMTPAGAAALAASGVAVSVANPFWLLWWATVGTAYIATSLEQGAAGVGVFYGAHFLTDLGWLSVIAFALSTGRRIMSRWVYRGVLMACGLFLLALGGWFLASGFGYIF